MTNKEKILEEFDEDFKKDNGELVEPTFKDPVGDFCPVRRFISQALDETIRAVCEECLEKIGEDENIRFLSYVSTSNLRARNKLRQELRQAINSLKGKYE